LQPAEVAYQTRPDVRATIAALFFNPGEYLSSILADPRPDDVYNELRAHFSEAETVNLTMLIATINAWNRIAIGFRSVPPVRAKASAA
jgi:alkylhydroperoxidase family enzyme